MKNVPEKIYLQIDADGETPEDFNELEVTWCAERINENDIAYIIEPSIPDKIDEAISYFEEIKSERESKKEDDTVLINYVLIILKSIKQRSHDRTNVSIKANEDAIIVNGKRYVKESETSYEDAYREGWNDAIKHEKNIKESETGEQEEIMKALEEARCLDPESPNWSYHAASRIALEAIKKTRKPLDR